MRDLKYKIPDYFGKVATDVSPLLKEPLIICPYPAAWHLGIIVKLQASARELSEFLARRSSY